MIIGKTKVNILVCIVLDFFTFLKAGGGLGLDFKP